MAENPSNDAFQPKQLLTAQDVTRILVGTIAEVKGVHLGGDITRASCPSGSGRSPVKATIAAILIGPETLSEPRLGEIVRAALGAAFDPMRHEQ